MDNIFDLLLRDQVFATLAISQPKEIKNIWNVRMKVDTGSTGNLLPVGLYTRIGKLDWLKPPKRTLSAYNGSQIKQYGTCQLRMRNVEQNVSVVCEFYITDDGKTPIVGLNDSRRLGLVTINCSAITSTKNPRIAVDGKVLELQKVEVIAKELSEQERKKVCSDRKKLNSELKSINPPVKRVVFAQDTPKVTQSVVKLSMRACKQVSGSVVENLRKQSTELNAAHDAKRRKTHASSDGKLVLTQKAQVCKPVSIKPESRYFMENPEKSRDMQSAAQFRDSMLKMYPECFKGVGTLEGRVHLELRDGYAPFQAATRRVAA